MWDTVRGAQTFRWSRDRVTCLVCLEAHNNSQVGQGGKPGAELQAFFDAHQHRRPSPPAAGARQRLAWQLDQLGEDEVEVLAEVAEGLAKGRRAYGELRVEGDRRDFDREALDEVRDGLAYAAMAAIRRRRGGAA
jgi:NTP pyrophosphatase (non-canonical NTP hydrolase)